MSFLKGNVCFFLCVAGFSLGCLVLRPVRVLPQGIANIFDKLSPENHYSTLFIGPSTVQNHLDPMQFDGLLHQAGIEQKTLAVGVPGIGLPEIDVLLETLIAKPKGQLKNLYIDVSVIIPRDARENLLIPEYVFLKTSKSFFESLKAFGYYPYSGNRLLEQLYLRGVDTVANEVNFGQIHHYLNRGYQRGHSSDFLTFHPKHGDYEASHNIGGVHINELLEKHFGNSQICTKSESDIRAERLRMSYLKKWKSAFLLRGINPVFFFSPSFCPSDCCSTTSDDSSIEITSFNDIKKYPELYSIKYRYDNYHLNTVGARLFTQIFAEIVASQYKKVRE